MLLTSEDYYLLHQKFSNHPVAGTLLVIALFVAICLLLIYDKRQEKNLKLERLERMRQSSQENNHHG